MRSAPLPFAQTGRTPLTRQLVRALAAGLLLAAIALPCAAQSLGKCVAGQRVIDRDGRIGTIVSQSNARCQVRYGDGQTYPWIYWDLRPVPGALQPELPAADLVPPQQPEHAAPAADVPAVTVLRPTINHGHVYRASRDGHFRLWGEVNGAPVRFLVDTGATIVFLTEDDARGAGLAPRDLDYTQQSRTANGVVRVAPVLLREVRIDDIALDNVRGAVSPKLGQSVLGMSFLRRLKGFEMHAESLTIDW
jgi:clan AA aspartic protease (TIGR02281 family)